MLKLVKYDLYRMFRQKFMLLIFLGFAYFICKNVITFGRYHYDNSTVFLHKDVFVSFASTGLPFIIMTVCLFFLSDEVTNGTIKISLLQGYSRIKVVNAKLLSCISVEVLLFVFLFILSYICAFAVKVPTVANPEIFLEYIKDCLYLFIPLTMIILLVAAISLYVKSNAVTIAICVVVYITCYRETLWWSFWIDQSSRYINAPALMPYAALGYFARASSFKAFIPAWSISCIIYSLIAYLLIVWKFSTAQIDN